MDTLKKMAVTAVVVASVIGSANVLAQTFCQRCTITNACINFGLFEVCAPVKICTDIECPPSSDAGL